MSESKFPKHLWGQAVLKATFLINRSTSKVIFNDIPAMRFERDMKLDNIKIFGCKA